MIIQAVEEDAIDLNQRLSIPDSYTVAGRPFHDAHAHPVEEMTLGDIIAYSSNVGAITVAGKFGRDRFSSSLHRFGFAHDTGLDFPGESAGTRPDGDFSKFFQRLKSTLPTNSSS